METAQRAHPRQPRANPPCTVCQHEARSHKALVRLSRRVQRGEMGSGFVLPHALWRLCLDSSSKGLKQVGRAEEECVWQQMQDELSTGDSPVFSLNMLYLLKRWLALLPRCRTSSRVPVQSSEPVA